jgi:hypothetical protein
VVPTVSRATYCPVMVPRKFERQVVLTQTSEIRKRSSHGITLLRDHRSGTRVDSRENRLVGAGEQEVPAGPFGCDLSHPLPRT